MSKKNLVDLTILLLAALLMVGAFILNFYLPMPRERVYNCSIAEISPDYPIEVKEGCRKLRMEKIK
jgi:hypothetical protein